MATNTIFLRLEGPLQAWGDHSSKFTVRRTMDIPSKSAVAGLLCAALGIPRDSAGDFWLPQIAKLKMGTRIDRAGHRWWDYHTVGAGMQVPIADLSLKKFGHTNISPELATEHPEKKPGAILSRREYLCDASFLVALQGSEDLLDLIWKALLEPHWQLFLGRKSCSPSRPLTEHEPGSFPDLISALASVPLSAPYTTKTEDYLNCWLDWIPATEEEYAPEDAVIAYDVPQSFAPHSYLPRFIVPHRLVAAGLTKSSFAYPDRRWRVMRPRADYTNGKFREIRAQRLIKDHKLCVLCKSPATTVQHISYEHAGGEERIEELASLCRLCHDAATMLEYGTGMGLNRIDPSDPVWRERLLAKRAEIVRYRSRAKRSEQMAIIKEEA